VEKERLEREAFTLAVLSAANGESHQPAHVQKLFFLIDRVISDRLGGPYFNFQPYDYGPFDKAVYETLDLLESQGDVEISRSDMPSRRLYRLTRCGQEKGEKNLDSLDPEAQKYIKEASSLVRELSFANLVSAIYKAYPEMKENSVFS